MGKTTLSNNLDDFDKKVMEVFEKFPTKFFTQQPFVELFGMSPRHVNNVLRRLVSRKLIKKTTRRKDVYYTKNGYVTWVG